MKIIEMFNERRLAMRAFSKIPSENRFLFDVQRRGKGRYLLVRKSKRR